MATILLAEREASTTFKPHDKMSYTDCNPAAGKRTITSLLANRDQSEPSALIDLGWKVPIFDSYFPFLIQCYLTKHCDIKRFHG